ncbi:hypothetical protein SAMN04244553_4547 [Nocardia amikacinitolerans]|uniref:Lipoprotein n=1 Tax=Nocardia amikacinitolerans TaxID=756689 RepID=A0A285LRR9_9NOCA|nr:hypothetical protein [Nocardia amikacinitolerans]MCP2295171.1 hypothetical protein [Nocardia amikacinitolerans]SNY87599.1 hypothetical protein SAMN04244553_4547 [Nocardia amikacinitolerans]
MHHRYPALAVSAAAIALACTSCAPSPHEVAAESSPSRWDPKPELTYVSKYPVREDLSEKSAQELGVAYLHRTLGALPPELSLVLSDRWDGRAVFDRNVDTCTIDRKVPDAPLGLWLHYLVTGAKEPARGYFDAFRSGWRSFGWEVTYEPTVEPDLIQATTPDHFTLTALVSSTGELGLDLASPCFPNAARGNVDPLPNPIVHP